MEPPLFTIFTATYNRAYILPKLYDSLCEQTIKNFEWVIVDDGSTDSTELLIKSWMNNDNGYEIRYFKKNNGGKPRAINYGIQFALGDYFIIIDSDDYFLPNAIKCMTDWIYEIDDKDDFIGIGVAKGYPDMKYLKDVVPIVNSEGYVDATNLELGRYNIDMDMCEAYRTSIFKKYPMAEWPGEKFAPEQIALNEIALAGYKLRWHLDILCICDYLEDGLTKGSRKLEKENPMGYAMMYNHMLKYNYPPKRKLFCAYQCIALSLYGKHPEYIFKSNSKLYTLIGFPFGIILAIRRALQFRKV